MSYYKACPFSTVFGVRYVLIFSEFDSGMDYDTPVIDVSLTCEDDLEHANDIDVLISINNLIKEYLSDFENVVLYYYCDTAPIVKSAKNEHLSNQEYRQILFDRMFEYARFKKTIKKSIVIEDTEQDKHFINLISHTKLSNTIDKIALDIKDFNK